MEYSEKVLEFVSLLVILGFALIFVGIVISEVEINEYKCKEIYGESNCNHKEGR